MQSQSILDPRLQDAANAIDIGQDSLNWLDAVLHAIDLLHQKELHKKGSSSVHIKYLTELGRYVITDIGNYLDGEHAKITNSIKVGEVSQ